jgi:hypothetical protein
VSRPSNDPVGNRAEPHTARFSTARRPRVHRCRKTDSGPLTPTKDASCDAISPRAASADPPQARPTSPRARSESRHQPPTDPVPHHYATLQTQHQLQQPHNMGCRHSTVRGGTVATPLRPPSPENLTIEQQKERPLVELFDLPDDRPSSSDGNGTPKRPALFTTGRTARVKTDAVLIGVPTGSKGILGLMNPPVPQATSADRTRDWVQTQTLGQSAPPPTTSSIGASRERQAPPTSCEPLITSHSFDHQSGRLVTEARSPSEDQSLKQSPSLVQLIDA